MANRYYSSVAQDTTLSNTVTALGTSIQVGSTVGFPASFPYTLILDPETATQEIVTVTAAAGTTLTVTRGEDGTSATGHDAGAVVRHGHSARDFRDSRLHEEATQGVHGTVGAIADTDGTQAFSNKDLSAATNTFPTTLARQADLNTTNTSLSNHTGATSAHGTTGAVVGNIDTQTLTNKTLDVNYNTINGFTPNMLVEADLNGKVASSTRVLPGGDFVGTTDTQTLSNKTLVAPVVNGVASVLSETWHAVGDPGEPLFKNGWLANAELVQFRKDAAGTLHIRGRLKTPTGGSGTVAFTLPASHRPTVDILGLVNFGSGNVVATMNIKATGDVEVWYPAGTTWIGPPPPTSLL